MQISFVSEAILIVLESQKAEIQFVLEKSDLEIKIDYVAITEEEDIGTADSLRLISDRLKSDVIVVSCDLVSDFNLSGVLDIFRRHNATLATLLFNSQPSENVIVPGPKSKHKQGKVIKDDVKSETCFINLFKYCDIIVLNS